MLTLVAAASNLHAAAVYTPTSGETQAIVTIAGPDLIVSVIGNSSGDVVDGGTLGTINLLTPDPAPDPNDTLVGIGAAEAILLVFNINAPDISLDLTTLTLGATGAGAPDTPTEAALLGLIGPLTGTFSLLDIQEGEVTTLTYNLTSLAGPDAVVPEPVTISIVGFGLASIGVARRLRKSKHS